LICGNYKLDTQHLDYSIMMVFGLIVKSLISIFLLMCLICDSSGDQAGIAYLKLADCHFKGKFFGKHIYDNGRMYGSCSNSFLDFN